MTNLKRVLSLALAAVMLMGMMVIGAGAANIEYTDAESIENAEAVEVLTALDVLGGYPDGSFKPEGTLTRAEAAAIICRIMLGADVAESLSTATAPFADVKATNWAAGYLAYLKNLGVISGIGNNKYNPQGTVTVGEFAKMLLGAAGIDGQFTGSSWLINVSVAAQKADILSSKDVVTDPATRDAVAGYTLNTLFYGETVTTTATEYMILAVSNPTAAPTSVIGKTYASYAAAITAATAANGSAQIGRDYTVSPVTVTKETKKDSLALDVFSITRKSGQADAYGRPATAYVQNDGKANAKTIATVANEAVAVYTTTVSANDLYNVLGYNAVIVASASQNTKTATAAGFIKADGSVETSTNITVSAKNVSIGGNGIVTEIYKVDNSATTDTVEYIAVQIQPTLYKLGAPTKTAATATEGAKTTFTVGGVNLVEYTTVVNEKNDKTNFTTDSALAKDDYVLVYGNATAGYTVKHATLVEGKLTGYNSKTGYIIGGTSYNKSSVVVNGAVADTDLDAYNQTATYALDAYGNVIGSVTVTTPTNYIYVLGAGDMAQYLNTTTNKVENVYEAAAITTAGEVVTIQVSKVGGNPAADTSNETANALYTYAIDKDGKYELTAPVADNVDSINKTPVLKASTAYADSTTKYYVAKQDATTQAWSITSYTGYANINLTGNPTATYLDSNNDKVAEVVFVNGGTIAGSTQNYVYVTGSFTSDGTTYTYDVIVNGEASTMVLTGVTGAGLYNVSNGTATAVSGTAALNITNGTDGKYDNGTFFSYSNGLLMTASSNGGANTYLAEVSASVPVYTLENGVCTTSTAADLSYANGTLTVVAVNAAHDAISAIYIVK